MRRGVLAVAGVALLSGACGGSSSSPTTPTPTPTPAPASSVIVVLDSGNFDAVALGASKPVLVEFHSPT